jgi:hypothetical protein
VIQTKGNDRLLSPRQSVTPEGRLTWGFEPEEGFEPSTFRYESKRTRPADAMQACPGCSRQPARPASAILTGALWLVDDRENDQYRSGHRA